MSLGKIGEDLVAVHYKKLGYQILEQNFALHLGKQVGELDLVARNNSDLVFVEVKTRSSQRFGSAFEAVDTSKQRKLVNMAKLYHNDHPELKSLNPRIDVASVDIDNKEQPVIILTNAIEDLS